MEPKAFWDMIAKDPDLEVVSCDEDKGLIYVKNATKDLVFGVQPKAVLAYGPGEFSRVFHLQRLPSVISHLSRIVGYFSRIENWNKSKLSELADRRAGQYSFPEKKEALA